jgi:4-diphosphocytidyl-2-C-methyl-D-erythritol kinase
MKMSNSNEISTPLQSVQLKSPSKINLRLKVTGRRTDGYHLLSMLNCLTDFSDTIRISVTSDIKITVNVKWLVSHQPQGVVDLNNSETNLAARAARLFFDRFALPFGAKIEIEKRIPLGGGLGGGSGNAAVVLNYLARVFAKEVSLSIAGLNELAATIGSDVPFMLAGGLGYVTGVGERVHSVSQHPFCHEPIWLLLPQFGIETGALFAELRKQDAKEFCHDTQLSDFAAAMNSGQLQRQDLIALIDNDLVSKVVAISPQMAVLHQQLMSIPSIVASMSGSGSTFFVLSQARMQQPEELSQLTEMLSQRFAPQGVAIIQAFIL